MPKLADSTQSRVTSIAEFSAAKRVSASKAQSEALVLVLEELLHLARRGEIAGLLFLIDMRGGRQHAGAHGSLLDNPSSLALASAKLWMRCAANLEESI